MSPKNSFLTATDQFCGAGGSSSGATAAGLEVKLAMNHWDLAIRTHNTNFPSADHDCADISASSPRRYRSTDFLITSPECTNHSLAKGKSRRDQTQLDLFGKITIDPAEERSRATMWDVPRFAEYHQYRIIIVENVVDARQWIMWDAWLHAMDSLGYNYQVVYFNSMFAHPTPQSRDRMYVVFWKKGNRAPNLKFAPPAYCPRCERNVESEQAWKNNRSAGRYKKQYVYVCPLCHTTVEPYFYCAANAIDWSIAAPRIGDRAKPLKAKTRHRIQVGLDKFGGEPYMADTIHSAPNRRNNDETTTKHFIMDLAHNQAESGRVYPVTEPSPTQTSYQTMGMVVPPFILSLNHSTERTQGVHEAAATMMPQTIPSMVVPPFMVEMFGSSTVRSIAEPLGTMMGTEHHGVVTPPFMVDLRGENAPKGMTDALSTVVASGNHHGVVVPFLASYYGTDNVASVEQAMPTVTTKDRHSLIVPPPFLLSYYTRQSGIGAALAGVDGAMPTQPTWPVHYLAQPGRMPEVDDCGFRMLQPHEIQRAMAFPDDYVILGNARQKVKQLGNAVTAPVMKMIVKRCIESLEG